MHPTALMNVEDKSELMITFSTSVKVITRSWGIRNQEGVRQELSPEHLKCCLERSTSEESKMNVFSPRMVLTLCYSVEGNAPCREAGSLRTGHGAGCESSRWKEGGQAI